MNDAAVFYDYDDPNCPKPMNVRYYGLQSMTRELSLL